MRGVAADITDVNIPVKMEITVQNAREVGVGISKPRGNRGQGKVFRKMLHAVLQNACNQVVLFIFFARYEGNAFVQAREQ